MQIIDILPKDIQQSILLCLPYNKLIQIREKNDLHIFNDNYLYKNIYLRDFGGNFNGEYKIQIDEIYSNIKGKSLIYGSENGYIKLVIHSIERGTDIHADDDAALISAAANGHIDIVKYLVENGADIHVGDSETLRWAATCGHIEVVKYLLDNGVNIHGCHDIALRSSTYNKHIEVVKYLVERGATICSKHLLWDINDVEIFKYFVKEGLIINDYDEAFMEAIYDGRIEAAKYLVEHGANNNKANNNKALQLAIQNNCIELVKYLKELMN